MLEEKELDYYSPRVEVRLILLSLIIYFNKIYMNDSDKIELVKLVLNKRKEILDKVLKNEENPYYEGKRDGYQQAIDLLNENIESIKIEL